ncbi:hypothetical protein [Marinisporobacter balticus]|uniref:Uncharacterized protein n=1 Tax=Marinisporobacter balticus TaxID=2018667 RepID=A0A4V2SCG1_9FIRM|nr:hypothetical protein [Marinisporobacter balticus]TCO79130.1 hypothetical protein EV214_103182 [Marinisporobacter balticus]
MDKITVCNKSPYFCLVENHVLGIPERLKQIDKSYFVVWNSKKEKFEVHSEDNVGSTYCFTVPYRELDCRTLEYARETRIERSDIVFVEIEKQDEIIEKAVKREREKLFDDIGREVFDRAMFEERSTKEV